MAEKIVIIRPKAMDHLQELRKSQGNEGDIFLRMGVRSGGCSGLSYIMDLVKKASLRMAFSHCTPRFHRIQSKPPACDDIWWSNVDFEFENRQPGAFPTLASGLARLPYNRACSQRPLTLSSIYKYNTECGRRAHSGSEIGVERTCLTMNTVYAVL